MPRTKLDEKLPNPRAVANLIERYIKIERKITIDEAAAAALVGRTRYYNRIDIPENFTLAELRGFGKALNIPQEEMITAFAEAIRY